MYITLCRVMAELNFIRLCHNLNCVYQWVMPSVLQEIQLLSAQSTVTFALNFGCMLSVGVICFEDRFCASKMGGKGKVGRHIHNMLWTWKLSWLAVERPWSALAGPFLNLLAQIGVETTPPPL